MLYLDFYPGYVIDFGTFFGTSWLRQIYFPSLHKFWKLVVLFVFADFLPSITMKITIKSLNQAHIRVQRVKTCKNMCFVFSFTLLRFVTVFQTVISTWRWLRGTLVCNPIQTHQPEKTICQFEENCLKITTVRVPHRKTYKKAVMTSSKQKFEKLKKVSSQIFVKIIWVNFQQIWPKIVEIIHPYRHTDRQTHRRTDRSHPLG